MPPIAVKAASQGERDHGDRAEVQADELRGARGVGRGDERLTDDGVPQEQGEPDGGGERDEREDRVLRLDEHSADVPRTVGDSRVRTRNLAERREEHGLGEDRDPDGDDQAGEVRGAPTDADGDDCDERRDEGGHERGDHGGQRERHPLAEGVGEERSQHGEDALREVDDPRRPVHEHQRHADDREHRARREAHDDELEERRHADPPPRYALRTSGRPASSLLRPSSATRPVSRT